jgi:hypothetical protein
MEATFIKTSFVFVFVVASLGSAQVPDRLVKCGTGACMEPGFICCSKHFPSKNVSERTFYSQHGPGVRMHDSWDNAQGDGAQTLLVGTTRAVTLVIKSRSCRCAWAL